MAEEWPDFTLLSNGGCALLWEGRLRPLNKEYVVQLLYSVVSFPFAGIHKYKPKIEVVNPLLQRRAEEPDTEIPHIFDNEVWPERPKLCLYDDGEWTSNDPISHCVPWTAEWLACYEGWCATGVWQGGGHGTERQRRRQRRHR